MPILVSDRIFQFTCDLAVGARLFSLAQVARHADLSWRTQPAKRASEMLRPYAEWFETSPGPVTRPYTWRLSSKGRRRLGVKWRPVSGQSQKAEHWLGLGDIWLALTFDSGRPERWVTEHYQIFDVYCIWRGEPYLIEYQRTPITKRKWEEKWRKRLTWYRAQKWRVQPRVVLVNTTGQTAGTLSLPPKTIHVRGVDELPRVLKSAKITR